MDTQPVDVKNTKKLKHNEYDLDDFIDDDFIDDDDDDEYYTGEDLHFFKSLSKEQQEKYIKLEESLLPSDSQKPLRFQILDNKHIPLNIKSHIINLMNNAVDYKKAELVNHICKIPFGKYRSMPVSVTDHPDVISTFLSRTRTLLDDVVFGHEEAKERISRLMAQWISNPQGKKGTVIGVEGPMGCGKTTLIKEGICKVLNLPFGFVPLGGCSDSSYLKGHSFTYEGSNCGRISEILMESSCMNTILYFDELDKVSNTSHGEEITNTLIHLTDPVQSECFQDRYFGNVDLDLSKSLIVFSFNNVSLIDPILRDRMTIIKTDGYKKEQKKEIAMKYLIPALEKDYLMNVVIPEKLIYDIIELICDEQGVRNLKRALEDIYSFINYKKMMQHNTLVEENDLVANPIVVTAAMLKKINPVGQKSASNASFNPMYL
eukprot:359696-Chlamydomonas_euryale.AAC.2